MAFASGSLLPQTLAGSLPADTRTLETTHGSFAQSTKVNGGVAAVDFLLVMVRRLGNYILRRPRKPAPMSPSPRSNRPAGAGTAAIRVTSDAPSCLRPSVYVRAASSIPVMARSWPEQLNVETCPGI